MARFLFIGLVSTSYHEKYKITNYRVLPSHRVDWEEKVANNNSSEYHNGINNSSQTVDSIEQRRGEILIVYVWLIVFATTFMMVRTVSFFNMCVRASINLHDMLFRGVTRAKMIFFNNNPSGRILNRFAGDISNVDSILPRNLFDVSEVSLKSICDEFNAKFGS